MTPEEETLVARINARPLYPLATDLGMRALEVDLAAQTALVAFEPRRDHRNAFESVHGGIVTAMLDNTGAIAGVAASRLTLGFPTLEIKTSFVAPVGWGLVHGHGRVLRLGKTISFLAAELRTPAGELLASASLTARSLAFDWTVQAPAKP